MMGLWEEGWQTDAMQISFQKGQRRKHGHCGVLGVSRSYQSALSPLTAVAGSVGGCRWRWCGKCRFLFDVKVHPWQKSRGRVRH